MEIVALLIAVILVGIVATLLNRANPFLWDILIFVLFLWAIPNYKNQQLGLFYSVMFLFYLMLKLSRSPDSAQPKLGAMGILLGLGLVLVLRIASVQSGGSIIGVPSFQVEELSAINRQLTPFFSGLAGIVENRFYFTLIELLLIWGHLPAVLALLVATAFMVIFHLAAYSATVQLISAFAFFAAIGGVYLFTRDPTAGDIAHFVHNFDITAARQGFSILGGLIR